MDFPTDDATLVMLRAACDINPDSGRSHLNDFLDMGSQIKSETDQGIIDSFAGPMPLVEVEYEEGKAPHSPQGVIMTLVDELMDLRSAVRTVTVKHSLGCGTRTFAPSAQGLGKECDCGYQKLIDLQKSQ